MRLLLVPFLLMVTMTSAWADRFQSRIYQIDISTRPGNPHLVKFENGRVAFLNPSEVPTMKALKNSKLDGDVLELELDQNFDLVAAATVESGHGPQSFEPPNNADNNMLMSYTPSVLGGLSSAQTIFSRMKRGWQYDSQCYNRAHVWAYEEFKRSTFKSQKLFLFFTSRYIRNYRYKWWFHVSPMALVRESGVIKRRVLDRRYTSGPRYVKTWTDQFIASKRSCPIVARYSQYRNNQETQDCYLIPVSQYYWQPRDIENYEKTGYEKTSFIQSEVNWSYYEAF
ncbi:MAG TPA: protein-glutamine glutaminase family protein [Bacteriovoracaceae bacterium]|nr:protein-glutamine glutaminase family protein [Bacteriovoracaceae bacterium]